MENPSPLPSGEILTVASGEGGNRLDVFLASRLIGFSRSRIQALIREGCVSAKFHVKALKPGLVVLPGQSFRVEMPPLRDTELAAQPLALDTLFEDGDLLVLNKPAGLVVHPGAGNPDHTLINALVAHCPGISGVGGVRRPGLVHRLDKDTSGLLAVAKTDQAYQELVRQLRYRRMGREYLGIVKGPLEGRGTVDAPIGRHAGVRKKMAVRPEDGKKARTHFNVLETGERASLLHLKLDTGRTHQIRVHLHYIHHPILGDRVYSSEAGKEERQMLHAFRLSLRHPRTGKGLELLAEPPEDFRKRLLQEGLKEPRWAGILWDAPGP
jgi:23S rRNA pseudouridine1911/1915/1917 synthase